jgi:hypothetical protein
MNINNKLCDYRMRKGNNRRDSSDREKRPIELSKKDNDSVDYRSRDKDNNWKDKITRDGWLSSEISNKDSGCRQEGDRKSKEIECKNKRKRNRGGSSKSKGDSNNNKNAKKKKEREFMRRRKQSEKRNKDNNDNVDRDRKEKNRNAGKRKSATVSIELKDSVNRGSEDRWKSKNAGSVRNIKDRQDREGNGWRDKERFNSKKDLKGKGKKL